MIQPALATLFLVALALPAAAQTAEALQAQAEAYTEGVARIIGRKGDIFTFCYEGGEGGQQQQGWRPVNPGTGAFVITRYCSGAPCPNWQTLNAYIALCKAGGPSTGVWLGQGGPGVIGNYQSSGGSQYKADRQSGQLQQHQH